MPRYVHVPTDATPHLIRQAYEAGGPHQWAREAWRNSEESGASVILFGVEEQAASNCGVLRRTIIDDGAGMSPEDMRTFLTTFGGGGKPIGVDGNFGQGFKSSVLPWNPYGVVVLSYSADQPDGAMLWIYRDDDGNYALREWPTYDEDDEYVGALDVVLPFNDPDHGCDWSKIRPSWLTTGTIMVLLGGSVESHTWMGDQDPSRAETVDGLIRYLNGRILRVPERDGKPVETTVVDLYRKGDGQRRDTKDKTVELPNGEAMVWRPRRVYGLTHYIPDAAVRGTVKLDNQGTTGEWHYVPEPHAPVAGGSDYVAQRPVIAIDYQGEVYHADHTKNRYRQFGITDEIMGRTWLVIQPPVYSDLRPTDWGVLTQASRNILIAKGGLELPWEAWGDAFYAAFPQALADARDAARAATPTRSDASTAKNLSRILDRLNPRFKASRVLTSSAGKIFGHLTDARSSTSGSTTRLRNKLEVAPGRNSGSAHILAPSPTGTVAGRAASVKGGYPNYQWKKFDTDEGRFLAVYNKNDSVVVDGVHSNGVVNLNVTHPVFVQEFNYWTAQVWPKADPVQVTELVKKVYGEEVVAHVVHAQRLNGLAVGRREDGAPVLMARSDVDELLEPAALSASLLGLVNVEQRLLTQGGGLFGSRSSN